MSEMKTKQSKRYREPANLEHGVLLKISYKLL